MSSAQLERNMNFVTSMPLTIDQKRDIPLRTSIAGLAQLVEHLICNQGVGGSSPSTGTISRRRAAGMLNSAPRTVSLFFLPTH